MIAETVPKVKVSSTTNKGNGNDDKGYVTKKSFRDGGGYDESEVFGDRDHDNYGFETEEGFGKRISARDGQTPKVQDKHSYKKVSKLGDNWTKQNEQVKDIDSIDDATTIRKKVEEKPKR